MGAFQGVARGQGVRGSWRSGTINSGLRTWAGCEKGGVYVHTWCEGPKRTRRFFYEVRLYTDPTSSGPIDHQAEPDGEYVVYSRDTGEWTEENHARHFIVLARGELAAGASTIAEQNGETFNISW